MTIQFYSGADTVSFALMKHFNIMKQALLLILFSATLFACKKDEDPTLEGKWTLDNITVKEYMNNTLVSTNTDPGTGETIEFTSTGNVIITEPGSSPFTTTYTISGDNVTFDGDTYAIQNLGDNNVTLYYRDTYNPGEYDDIFINLKR
jgi:hypothetical protein